MSLCLTCFRKIFVGGLNNKTNESIFLFVSLFLLQILEVLRLYFEKFGAVESVSLVCDPSGKSKGYGFITFEYPEPVVEVLKKIHVLDHRQV